MFDDISFFFFFFYFFFFFFFETLAQRLAIIRSALLAHTLQ